MADFIKAFLLIFLAEMGDKTQLLAFAFATQYKTKQVLLGVMLGSFLNHGIAVAFAQLISSFANMDYLKIIAGLMFFIFGILSFKIDYDDEEEEEGKGKGLDPVATVALAFFVGELGDKTQLTAMTLGLESQLPWMVLAGTTLGMVLVSSLGIVVGRVMGKKIPEVTMKLIAGVVFILFGFTSLLGTVRLGLLDMRIFIGILIAVTTAVVFVFYRNGINRGIQRAAILERALARCRHCRVHSSECQVGMDIEAATKDYLGADIRYLGNLIRFFEDMKAVDPTKSAKISGKFDPGNC
ncbi:MAG: TMEM165/GDT1 family protein [Tissierellia bacterium]|nr:TMEM165/GDT1 family protein [Tissierellia bacterium]